MKLTSSRKTIVYRPKAKDDNVFQGMLISTVHRYLFNTESLDFKENFTVLVFCLNWLPWEWRKNYGGPYAHNFRFCSNSLCYPLPSVLLATVDGNSTDYRLHLNHLDYSIQHESVRMIYTYTCTCTWRIFQLTRLIIRG